MESPRVLVGSFSRRLCVGPRSWPPRCQTFSPEKSALRDAAGGGHQRCQVAIRHGEPGVWDRTPHQKVQYPVAALRLHRSSAAAGFITSVFLRHSSRLPRPAAADVTQTGLVWRLRGTGSAVVCFTLSAPPLQRGPKQPKRAALWHQHGHAVIHHHLLSPSCAQQPNSVILNTLLYSFVFSSLTQLSKAQDVNVLHTAHLSNTARVKFLNHLFFSLFL